MHTWLLLWAMLAGLWAAPGAATGRDPSIGTPARSHGGVIIMDGNTGNPPPPKP